MPSCSSSGRPGTSRESSSTVLIQEHDWLKEAAARDQESRYQGKNIIQKYLRISVMLLNYNFPRGFVWVWNMVADIDGGTQAEGVWE
jgi:hypothetical protein